MAWIAVTAAYPVKEIRRARLRNEVRATAAHFREITPTIACFSGLFVGDEREVTNSILLAPRHVLPLSVPQRCACLEKERVGKGVPSCLSLQHNTAIPLTEAKHSLHNSRTKHIRGHILGETVTHSCIAWFGAALRAP